MTKLKHNHLLLLGVITILLVTNSVTLFLLTHENKKAEFSFLDQKIASLEVEQFQQKQTYYATTFAGLEDILTIKYGSKDISIYYEDLKTGAWVGINEQTPHIPGSLLKVPTLIATMKKIEEGELTLEKTITLTEEDIDNRFGYLWQQGAGYQTTIGTLVNMTATISDNTADNALRRQLAYGEYAESLLASGIPYTANIKNNVLEISAKDYSNILRSLYYSNYLKRSSSNYLLSLLAHTIFEQGLPAGVPSHIQVSHKIGTWQETGEHHDCGIIYVPKKPYLLCVMTTGTETTASIKLTEDISRDIYTYVIEQWEGEK